MKQKNQFHTSFFKKRFYVAKANSQYLLIIIYFGSPRLGHAIKTNSKNLRLLIQRYAQLRLRIFREESGAIFSIIFLVKCLSCYIQLSDCLYFLRYWSTFVIISFSVDDVTKFETNLSFLIKSCFLHDQKSQDKKSIYLMNRKRF